MSSLLTKSSQHLRQILSDSIDESIQAVSQLKQPNNQLFMERAANMLAECFTAGNKVLIAGNGGSLCDANHFAEEFTGFFRKSRPPLPVIALTDPGHITCTANDLHFEWIFARAIQAYAKPNDIFIGLTTSGNSANLVKAFEVAKELGLYTIAFIGKSGGRIKGMADLELIITGFETSDKIQEAHMAAMHMIIELVEHLVFPQSCE